MANGEHKHDQGIPGKLPIDVSLVTNSPAEIPALAVSSSTQRRGRAFPALERTGIAHTFYVRPQVLTREQLSIARDILTTRDATRLQSLTRVEAINHETLSHIKRVGILVDGRGLEEGENGEPIKSPDGWWGDTIQASSVIRSILGHGLGVDVYSTQPDLFSKEGNDDVRHFRIPDDTFPFQFYPFGDARHPELMEFLYKQQKPDMAFLVPINARFPILFRLEKRRGQIVFDERTRAAVDALQIAAFGTITDSFSGITQRDWNKFCHHTHAYQIMTDLLGLYDAPWEAFPRPYVNPSPFAEVLAQDIVNQFSPTGINALLHIGSATNTPRKVEKFYPPEQWKEVLDQIASKRPDLIGSIIMFKPINPLQAALAERIAEHAIQVFGSDRVIVTPLQKDWTLSSLDAVMRALARRGVVAGMDDQNQGNIVRRNIVAAIDSGPAHLARAEDALLAEVGNKEWDPDYYAPTGGMVVLPARGKSASGVKPEDVADAFIALAEAPLPN